ncbi:MAG: hypothetical protein U9Q70_09805 [Chloroflexota bacterium]|nr:hypothetical protein [Chloroflexota bacterium]
MHHRRNPYSCIEKVQRSRSEVLALILVTVVLGVLLGLLTDGLAALLQEWLAPTLWRLLLVLLGLLVLFLLVLASWLLSGRTESRRARLNLWLPYHLPRSERATIAVTSGYPPLRHARRLFAHRYPTSAQPEFLALYAEAQAEGQLFPEFIAAEQLALSQCLVLYVLHHYADRSLGYEAPYGWWESSLETQRLAINELPRLVAQNPFLQADQDTASWRLLLPQGVTFEAHRHQWLLRHRLYGEVSIRWHPRFPVAGHTSQPYRASAERLKLHEDSELHVIGTRLEAVARLNYTFLPAGDPCREWLTGFLARLEESLDYDYYLATLPDHIIRELAWKVGWVPAGSSLVEMLQCLQGQLEELELSVAEQQLATADEEPTEDFVV